jgi:hypothetical protein
LVRLDQRGRVERAGCEFSTLPSDEDEHVVLAGVVRHHADDLDGFPFLEWRDNGRCEALRLERETDFVFQIVITSSGLFIRPGIDDRFAVDAVFPDRVFSGSVHRFGPRTRRTEVRPISSRRAISDLLTAPPSRFFSPI